MVRHFNWLNLLNWNQRFDPAPKYKFGVEIENRQSIDPGQFSERNSECLILEPNCHFYMILFFKIYSPDAMTQPQK